jgi:hypothetical protein
MLRATAFFLATTVLMSLFLTGLANCIVWLLYLAMGH